MDLDKEKEELIRDEINRFLKERSLTQEFLKEQLQTQVSKDKSPVELTKDQYNSRIENLLKMFHQGSK